MHRRRRRNVLKELRDLIFRRMKRQQNWQNVRRSLGWITARSSRDWIARYQREDKRGPGKITGKAEEMRKDKHQTTGDHNLAKRIRRSLVQESLREDVLLMTRWRRPRLKQEQSDLRLLNKERPTRVPQSVLSQRLASVRYCILVIFYFQRNSAALLIFEIYH